MDWDDDGDYDGEPVSVRLQVPALIDRSKGRFEVIVTLQVDPMYEIHALDSPPPSVATKLDLVLPSFFQNDGDWQTPESVTSSRRDGHGVYVGQCTFRKQIAFDSQTADGSYEIECHVRYQACNARHCLRPQDISLKVGGRVKD